MEREVEFDRLSPHSLLRVINAEMGRQGHVEEPIRACGSSWSDLPLLIEL